MGVVKWKYFVDWLEDLFPSYRIGEVVGDFFGNVLAVEHEHDGITPFVWLLQIHVVLVGNVGEVLRSSYWWFLL